MIAAPTNVDEWYEKHKEEFAPPVCNKLLHRNQLTVMFVGGPNTRTDFHVDQSSEFFYQLRGNMQLPIIERGLRRTVHIRQGQVFLLPSRVPHSPQRPETGSLGFVLERRRYEGEVDGLRWYTDFDKCERVLYEKYFQCFDLGRDLVPVVAQFNASAEKAAGEPSETSVVASPPFVANGDITVPDPIDLQPWLDAHAAELRSGAVIPLFPSEHPDKEIGVRVCGGPATQKNVLWEFETLLWQLKGSCRVKLADRDEWTTVGEGQLAVVACNTTFTVEREADSIGWWITQDPCGNNADNRKRIEGQ